MFNTDQRIGRLGKVGRRRSRTWRLLFYQGPTCRKIISKVGTGTILTVEQVQTTSILYIKSVGYFCWSVQGENVSFDMLLKVVISSDVILHPHAFMSVAGLSSCHSTCLFPCLYPSFCVFIPCLPPPLPCHTTCLFLCNLPVCLSFCMTLCLSVTKSIPLSVLLPFCHPTCLPLCLPHCLSSVSMSVPLSVPLSVALSKLLSL